MKHIGWVMCAIWLAPALYALDVEVDRSFKITGIKRTGQTVVLPAQRKRYYNIRILDPQTYRFVSQCSEPCVQPLGTLTPQVIGVRPARTRQDMWIADVGFAKQWFITFLVFEKPSGLFDVQAPSGFTFLDGALKQRTHQAILQQIKQENP